MIFWVGFIVFSIGSAMTSTFSTGMIRLIQLFQGIGLLCIVYSTIRVIQFKVQNDFLKLMLVLYFCWSLFVVFNGFLYDYTFFKRVLFQGIFKYFLPIIILFPKNINFYKRTFDVIVILCVAYFVLNLVYLDIVLTHYDENVNQKFTFEGFTKDLGVPAGFVLFTFIYHSKYRNTLALLVVVFIILVATYKARRAVLALATVQLVIFAVIFYIKSSKKLLIILSGVVLLLLAIPLGKDLFMEHKDTFFDKVIERGAEDTRTGVELAFKRDFETVDWIVGRGINGKYWCPNVDLNDTTGYRVMIETEYLNIILKGGLIHLGLILIIILPAAFKALFYSRNLLSKAAGIWIVLWVLCLYPLNVFSFDMNYLLLWVCVSIGYSKDVRMMSDNTIKAAFSST